MGAGLAATKKVGFQKLDDEDAETDITRDMQMIMQSFIQLKQKAQNDGAKKSEEIITNAKNELLSMLEESKKNMEKDWQTFMKSSLKIGSETESMLKAEAARLEALHDKYLKDCQACFDGYEDILGKYEEAREKLMIRYDHQRKKNKASLADARKASTDKLVLLEEEVKKRQSKKNSYSMLRKSLGSLLDTNSDDDA